MELQFPTKFDERKEKPILHAEEEGDVLFAERGIRERSIRMNK